MNRLAHMLFRYDTRSTQLLVVLASSTLLLCTVCGCSDGALGGGASIEPSVRVLVELQGDATTADEEIVEVAGWGTFTGRVVLQGDLPTVPSTLPAGALRDPTICIRPQIPNESLVVDSVNNGIKNVFIFLTRKPPGTPAAPVQDPVRRRPA